jgi:D-alanine-D-alanine ligase-like ATP-grasp enzyme
MMEDFHIVFGAFDFIVTPDDEWVFLEVNPNGQWLWLEESLQLDISQKIVEYLTK